METKICNTCGRELPIENFRKTRWGGQANVCKECMCNKRVATHKKNKEQQHKLALADYTPRQLMEELARRGYEGKLTYTKIETIDITNF